MKRILTGLALIAALGLAGSCGGYDPCGDKNCGDQCTLCDPDDSDCVESAGFKVCNGNAVCTAAAPAICS